MGKQLWRPGNMLYPLPAVLVSVCDGKGADDLLTVAWAGTVCSDPVCVSVSVRKERFSHHMIAETGEFVINLTTEDMARAVDLCGVRSGRDTDKFAACGLPPVAVPGFDAPAIGECPIYLACKVKSVQELGSHDLFLGEITHMGVKPGLMDASGKIDFSRADLVAYNHGVYYALGEALGFFGYSVAAKDVLERRMKELK